MEITAMQELIQYVDSIWSNEGWEETIKEKAKELLEKEKQQLVDTYWDAYKEGQVSSDVTAEEYYNQKYNNDTTRTNSNI
jgi:hypothetical protein